MSEPVPPAWTVALLAWAYGHPERGPYAEAVMYAARAHGSDSPLDVTAAEVVARADRLEMPDRLRHLLRPGMAEFSRWAVPRELLEGPPYVQ